MPSDTPTGFYSISPSRTGSERGVKKDTDSPTVAPVLESFTAKAGLTDLEKGKQQEASIHDTDTTVVDRSLDTNYARDGGLAGWTCVLGSFLALFCTFGWLNS